jgi:hypothetical protein
LKKGLNLTSDIPAQQLPQLAWASLCPRTSRKQMPQDQAGLEQVPSHIPKDTSRVGLLLLEQEVMAKSQVNDLE